MGRRWIHSLSARFLLAFALVALLGVGTVAVVIDQVTTREFTLYVSRGGQMRAQRWAEFAAEYYRQTGSWVGIEAVFGGDAGSPETGGSRGPGRGWRMQGAGDPDYDRFLIADPDGWVVFDTADELVGLSIDAEQQEGGAPIVVDGNAVGTLWATTGDLSGHSELERRFLDAVDQALLWAVLLVAVASLIAAAFLSRQLVAPLHKLTAAAEAMAEGDLSQRVVVRTRDEVGELAQAFNHMAGDLQAAQVQRRQMTADIAHELRNPLSIIRGNLEAVLDGVYPQDAEHLSPIYEETMLLQRLVEDLRLLSLADAGQLQLIRTDVNVSELLNGVAESARAAADDKGVDLRVDSPPDAVYVEGDVDRLRQVIGNLVSNALCYTPRDGAITLHARQAEHLIRIAVTDTGQGIAPADLSHVFDRFYRSDNARDRASGGSGLGLAIARAWVEAHGGEIEVESTVGKGSTFQITLPRT
jgi:signal transduction histidine kinase